MKEKIAIIGVGTQGSMIAFRNAIHGKEVIGYSRNESSRERCRARIERFLEFYVESGRLDKGRADAARARISYAASLEEACLNASMVIENVPEILEKKQEIFSQLDKLCPPETLLSSNTSSLLMTEICASISEERKCRTFQVDHDDPVRNNYLEMMWNRFTAPETKAAALQHYRDLGFDPIVTEREIKGYSINRVWRSVKKECLRLWAEGYVTPEDFDRGWKMEWNTDIGPFKLMDLIGLDTICLIENSYYDASGDETDKPPKKLKAMVDAGQLGMKTGEGFYTGYDTEGGNLISGD